MTIDREIDLIDKKILQELATDGRLPFAELGRKSDFLPRQPQSAFDNLRVSG